jgi:hypothetical protein
MSSSAADRRTPLGLFPGQLAPRLYDCVGEALRSRYHSRRTEEAYLHWIHRFLRFHLAVDESVAASTQKSVGGGAVPL